jgi:argininosuccinate lyase
LVGDIYAETVLAQNFEDAKTHFLEGLIDIHYAHTRMLARQGILTSQEEKLLLTALGGLDYEVIKRARFDGSHEDLFFFIESMLESACGIGAAGKMHTARSRNDIAITLYRMSLRQELLKFAGAAIELRRVLLELACRHRETVMPAHTHTQPAQPTTLAHYVLAAIEFLGRDLQRLQAAFINVNRSPMGACAITTTGFPIDREITARLLGFEGLAENSYGAIASIDYLTESASAMAVAMVNQGKFLQDLLLWSTREFGFLRLSDAFVQTSSIMPQKRNPVALEHARILASRALGQAQALFTCAHNTPFGDINDSEDDLQPLVIQLFDSALRSTRLLTGVLQTVEINVAKLAAQAAANFLTVTELADTLVRSTGISFRQAHSLVARAVKVCGNDDSPEAIARAIRALDPGLEIGDSDIENALDPLNFVRIRRVKGGPAPEVTAEAIDRAVFDQQRFVQWLAGKESLLKAAQRENREGSPGHTG